MKRQVKVHPALAAAYGSGTLLPPQVEEPNEPDRKHGHYFKDVSNLDEIDVYRTLKLFGVNDPCLQHAIKKLLVAGGRGGGKDSSQDIQEAIDTLKRYQQMETEDLGTVDV